MEKRTHGFLFTLVVAVSIAGLLLYAAVAGALNIRGTQAFAETTNPAGAVVDVDDTSKTYSSVTEALNGGSYNLKLSADIADNIIIPSGKTVTIDLNDHVLRADLTDGERHCVVYVSGESSYQAGDPAKLTIKDTTEESARTTRYFTDEKCNHGVSIGSDCADCGVCEHGVYSGLYCKTCDDYSQGKIYPIAKQDGCYETLSTVKPSGEEGSDYLAIKGGVITGGTGYDYDGWGYSYDGGGIYTKGSLTLENINVVGNGAGLCAGKGGGIFADNKFAEVTIKGGFICGNYADHGGALYMSASTVKEFELDGVTISRNQMGTEAAVINWARGGRIIDSIITENRVYCKTFDLVHPAGVYADMGLTLGGNTYIYNNFQYVGEDQEAYQANLAANFKYYKTDDVETHEAHKIKFANPNFSSRSIGLTILDIADKEVLYISDEGDKDYSDCFVSDNFSYYLASDSLNRLILCDRITQQPDISNGYQVCIQKDDLADSSVTYQWRKKSDQVRRISELPEFVDEENPGCIVMACDSNGDDAFFEGDSITCNMLIIMVMNLEFAEGDYVTFKCSEHPEIISTGSGRIRWSRDGDVYTVKFDVYGNEGGFTIEFEEGEDFTLTDFATHHITGINLEGKTTDTLTGGESGSIYDCVITVNGQSVTSNHVEWTGEPDTNTYTVTFDSDGGSAVASQTVEKGACATEPVPPTKDGCTFKGWFAEGASVAYDFATPVTGDMTLTAKWEVAGSEEPVPVVKTGDEAGMVIVLSALAMLCAAGAVCIARKKRCE